MLKKIENITERSDELPNADVPFMQKFIDAVNAIASLLTGQDVVIFTHKQQAKDSDSESETE
ncbi:hypothetical protein A2154_03795 [Candidatus Gottesmanbacteria bacterium RBG_16_43_7]|uniref:Uncharacterized protein n=1 Tax=Candidatus Gottesmanbacteria bacterium RBG_16_43_7 TaxID=1798373 RepID=A0A1F5Z8J8_9BACT|nr:MAG: hypothetical protein A2154_03795 [Candidatus Gottesmanbacteria bacterium RBG_16_43_7]